MEGNWDDYNDVEPMVAQENDMCTLIWFEVDWIKDDPTKKIVCVVRTLKEVPLIINN